jgi:uncharacterized protein (DUF1330 family)
MSAAYLVAAIDIRERERYKDYVRAAVASFTAVGAKALAISDDPIALEGESPGGRFVLIEFPSQDALQAWYDSQEYKAARELRFATASTPFLLSVSGINH